LVIKTPSGPIRILDRETSCELRYNGLIIVGNGDFRDIFINFYFSGNDLRCRELFAIGKGLSVNLIDASITHLISSLNDLGVPVPDPTWLSDDTTRIAFDATSSG